MANPENNGFELTEEELRELEDLANSTGIEEDSEDFGFDFDDEFEGFENFENFGDEEDDTDEFDEDFDFDFGDEDEDIEEEDDDDIESFDISEFLQ